MKCPICHQELDYSEFAENSVYTPYYCWNCDMDFREEDLKQDDFIDIILNNKKELVNEIHRSKI